MADRKYYVICELGCRFESMTKEQILTAITQAVNEGTIGDIDTGFVTTIKTVNGTSIRFFYGTEAEYNALSADERENLVAVFKMDNKDIAIAIENLNESVEEHSKDKENPHNVTLEQIGAAASSHTHTKSQITDFPETENWTFTLEDGSTVTKAVYVG